MIICGNCREKHETVQEVRDCFGLASTPDRSKPATEKQINFAQVLLRDREPYGVVKDVEETNSIEAACEYINQMDFNQIHEFIGTMKDQPVRETRRPNALKSIVSEGMYKVGKDIYKVQKAVQGSGHLYAKKLLPDGGFDYAPGVVTTLTEDDKMTLEEAKEYGALYGTCCVCGRTLTNEQSIEDGIGPICAGKEDFFA